MQVGRRVVATVLLCLVASSAYGATPANVRPARTLKIVLPSDFDDVSKLIGSGTSWLVVGNVDSTAIVSSPLFPTEATKGGSDGYIAMLDSSLNLSWSHRFGTAHDDVATAIAQDPAGTIWTVGVTSKEAVPTPSPTPTATMAPSPPPTMSPATPIPTANPDGVQPVPLPTAPTVADQLLISSWSSSGQLLTQSLTAIKSGVAIDPTAAIASKNGIYVVGTAVDASAGTSRGFFLLVSPDGSIGPTHWLGSSSVVIRAGALLGNGSLVLAGSISEPLTGKPAIGTVDALVAIVNPGNGAVLRTIRSGNKAAIRSWESIGVDRAGNLTATGSSRVGGRSELVATSFTPTGTVRFSIRIPDPVGTQISLPAPTGAAAAIAVASGRPGQAYLRPLSATGLSIAPTYLVGKATTGLLAGAYGKGYLLATGDPGILSLAWFAPRGGK